MNSQIAVHSLPNHHAVTQFRAHQRSKEMLEKQQAAWTYLLSQRWTLQPTDTKARTTFERARRNSPVSYEERISPNLSTSKVKLTRRESPKREGEDLNLPTLIHQGMQIRRKRFTSDPACCLVVSELSRVHDFLACPRQL